MVIPPPGALGQSVHTVGSVPAATQQEKTHEVDCHPRQVVVAVTRAHRQRVCCRQGQHQYRRRYRRSEEHTSELQSLMRISYAVFCLKKTKAQYIKTNTKQAKIRQKS